MAKSRKPKRKKRILEPSETPDIAKTKYKTTHISATELLPDAAQMMMAQILDQTYVYYHGDGAKQDRYWPKYLKIETRKALKKSTMAK